ncbi:MAG: SusC/RagA family TonB-linked outer membrane protein, partial [Flammeovirgaceae bacterium]
MTILKGPAATVQYGIRGSNGVVIITTKKGKNKQKATISFSSTTTIDEVNKLPEMQLKWAQGRNGVYQDPSSGQATSWGPEISTLRLVPDPTYPYDRNGRLVNAASAPAGALPAKVYDNTGTFYQTGLTQDNFISASAGSDKSTIYASAGYLKQRGIIPLSDFERYTFKVNAETAISDKLRVGAGVTYTQSGGRRIQQGSNLSGLMLGLL